MKKKVVRSLCLALSLAFVLSACMACAPASPAEPAAPAAPAEPASPAGSAAPAEPAAPAEQKYKDTLTVGVDTEPVSFDNHTDADTGSLIAMSMVYDSLVRLDPVTKEIMPSLAESWETPDNMTYVFKLRQGVKFTDGSELTAEDVKWSYERQKELIRSSAALDSVESFEVIDDYTIAMHLGYPCASLLMLLSGTKCGIQSRNSMASGEWTCIGCGPYICTDWKAGDSLTFTRNENYWGEYPKTETIIFRLIPEVTSRLIALETGEIDVCMKVPANDKDKISSNPDLCIFEAPSAGVEYIVLNCVQAPFDDVRVRRALSAATNREELVQGVFQGEGVVCNTPVGHGVLYHLDDLDVPDNDPELAKQLLTEAGYPDGFSFSILVKGSQQQLTAQILQAQYAKVGITMDIAFMENTAFFDALNRGDFDAGMITLGAGSGDPTDQLDKLYGESLGSAGNRGCWVNPDFDALWESALGETDYDKRGEMFYEMQRIVAAEQPYISMMCANLFTGAVKGLEGYMQEISNTATLLRQIYLPID